MNAAFPPIFRLLWPCEPGEAAEPDENEWQAIAANARAHRLRPLLHARSAGWTWQPPQALAEEWQASYRRSAEHALRLQAEMDYLFGIFEDAAISACVLKGGAIFQRGWFAPALRPMRDLDLLVTDGSAQTAQELLRSMGYIGEKGENFENEKHLPGLHSPKTRTTIELHTHLIEPAGRMGSERNAVFWRMASQRLQRMPKTNIMALSDTDTLLHLILHGALDHQFNNGPLLVFDMLALMDNTPIDWAIFWHTAELTGGIKACQLALALLTMLAPEAPVQWCGHNPGVLSKKMMIGTAHLMLVERHERTFVGLPGRIARQRLQDWPLAIVKGLRRFSMRKPKVKEPRHNAVQHESAVRGMRERLRTVGQSIQVARWLRD
jgi:Uncharacterised nucleotidyltransferase